MSACNWEKTSAFVSVFCMLGAAVSLMFFLSGCGTTSGWRVSFGVAPVASLNENQTTLDKRAKD